MPNVKAIAQVIKTVMYADALRGTKYLSHKDIIRVTRVSYRGAKAKRRILKRENIELVITMGRPNFVEREFIRKCKKVGEPFPVKKVQLKYAN